jgi:hypothetical protein
LAKRRKGTLVPKPVLGAGRYAPYRAPNGHQLQQAV